MKYILTNENYFSHIGTDPVENAVALEEDKNFCFENQPTKFHKWDGEKFILDEVTKQKSDAKDLLQGIYNTQDELALKIQRNDYKYKIKSPETYDQYKNEYEEEMKVLILQEQELQKVIDGV